MKKKIISIILILIMLLLPFGVLLNTNAEGIDIETDSNGKVTNYTGEIVVRDINAKKTEQGYDIAESDTFKAYKVIDIYYNRQTNEISYRFTTDFNRFIGTLTSSFIGSITNPSKDTFTVEDYLKLTSDQSDEENECLSMNGDVCENYESTDIVNTKSTLNKLVSKYATYIRENPNYYGSSNTDVKSMTNSVDNDIVIATATGVVPGSYLVLQDSISDDAMYSQLMSYGVMIANVSIAANNNNEWVIDNVNIHAKNDGGGIGSIILPTSASDYDIEDEMELSQDVYYTIGKDYSYYNVTLLPEIPANASASIKSLEAASTLDMVDITFPTGVTPDLTEVYLYLGDKYEASIENGKYILEIGGETAELANVEMVGNKLSFDCNTTIREPGLVILFNLIINRSSLNTGLTGNTITTTTYIIKDPYVDIGNVTKSDIKAAFDTEDANYSSNQSAKIRQAMQRIDQVSNIYVDTLIVNNTNSSSANLSGGEFAVYSTYENGAYSNQLGNNIVISDGTGTFIGIDPNKTYFLKQEKAPSGYRLYDDKVIVLKGANDETEYDSTKYVVVTESNGMYTANVVNSPMLSLPFTGGEGTTIFIVLGLLVIAFAVILLILYKKINKSENKLKKLYKK